jgi:hypothetical protein
MSSSIVTARDSSIGLGTYEKDAGQGERVVSLIT